MSTTPSVLGIEKSVLGRCWRARLADDRAALDLAQKAGIPEPFARILAGRGIGPNTLQSFLNPKLRDEMPRPSSVIDVDVGAARIMRAIRGGEEIVIYADYDVDGATSGAILVRYLRQVGGIVRWYVPDRVSEGYGPNPESLRRLKDDGAGLVVFVDSGTTAIESLNEAKRLALDAVIVDHHQTGPELPACVALINPHRHDVGNSRLDLCSAGLAFILVAGLHSQLTAAGWFGGDRVAPDLFRFLDLVALGTVCDVMPLSGLNRAFVSQGLKAMAMAPTPGLAALAAIAGVAIRSALTPYHLGFVVGPRINAGGRIGKSDLGLRLLASDDPAEIEALALHLDSLNRERQAIERGVLDEARAIAAMLPTGAAMIAVAREGWHQGVIGIVAGRLKDQFHRPSIVGAIDGDMVKCSLRSVDGVDIGAAVAQLKHEGLALSGGGHAMAAGLNLARDLLEQSFARLDDIVRPMRLVAPDARRYAIDAVMQAGAMTPEFYDLVMQAAPFGNGNAEPVFALADVEIAQASRVGQDHVAVELRSAGGGRLRGVAFRAADTALGEALQGGARLHVAGKMRANDWRGARRIEFSVEDAAIP